jgi:hypothetical protein
VFLAPDHPKALNLPDPAAKAAAAEAAEEMASTARIRS